MMAENHTADVQWHWAALHISRDRNMEYLTLTETSIYQEMDHVLGKGMLNCLSGTASKQGTFKTTHDLTKLAVANLLPL